MTGITRQRKNRVEPTVVSNAEVRALVRRTFEAICNATKTAELDAIVQTEPLLKKRAMSETQYPKLQFNITAGEIESLAKRRILDNQGRLKPGRKDWTALEKLLYAVIWKNGDLGKERHIVRGIKAELWAGNGGAKGPVFFHFGKYLADQENPIIDQHVIRSFRLYALAEMPTWDSAATDVRSKGDVDDGTIKSYEEWLKNSLRQKLRAQRGYRFHVDKVLFALGRAVKASAKAIDSAEKARKAV